MNAASIGSENAMGVDLLGEVVAWELSGEVKLRAVRDALKDAGLSDEHAKDLRITSAFSRACKHLKKERAIDKVVRNDDILKFQFTRKWEDDQRIEYDWECDVFLNVETGKIECPDNPKLADDAKELFDEAMGIRTGQDITRAVQAMFKAQADLFSITSKGVAYFVPEAHRLFTDKVAAFVTGCGGRMERFPVPKGTTEANSSVYNAVESGMEEMIEELDEATREWDESTRPSTKKKAVKKIEEIEFRLQAYAEYLQQADVRLSDRLRQLRADVATRTFDTDNAREAAKVAKDDPSESGSSEMYDPVGVVENPNPNALGEAERDEVLKALGG